MYHQVPPPQFYDRPSLPRQIGNDKRVTIEAPRSFRGTPEEDFKIWWQQIEDFITVQGPGGFPDEQFKIVWVGSKMRDHTYVWYQAW